jgi:hypothetical protein
MVSFRSLDEIEFECFAASGRMLNMTDKEIGILRITVSDETAGSGLAVSLSRLEIAQMHDWLACWLAPASRPHGCVWPPGAEATCQGAACPRRSP